MSLRSVRRPVAALLAVAALGASAVGWVSGAAPASAADAQLNFVREFTHTLGGVNATGTTEAFSTPAIGDITGDGAPDVVYAGMDGTLHARHANGGFIWSKQVSDKPIQSSPALKDVSADGKADVVVGVMDGTVRAYSGPTGTELFKLQDVPSLACSPGVYCKPRGFFGTPAVSDMDGDGRPEVIATSWDHQVYVWKTNGQRLVRRYLEDTVWSSPVVADINFDGSKEIITGGDQDAVNGRQAGGWLFVLKSDGSNFPGYPKFFPGQVIWSSPSVADVDGDHNLDIVFGSGLNFSDPNHTGWKVRAYSGATGQPLDGWPVPTSGQVMGSPAIGDIDGDGRNEVVAATEGGYVDAWDHNGTRKWHACNASGSCSTGYPTHGSAVIADIDDDGQQEVVSALDKHLRVFNGANGAEEREIVLGASLWAPGSAPSIAEVNGQTWIVHSGQYNDNGGGRGSGDTLRVKVYTTGTGLGRADWPTFKRTMDRSGLNIAGVEPYYPFADAGDFVRQQYRDFLGREPDTGGYNYWVGQLSSGKLGGAKLIALLIGSPEFGEVLEPVIRLHFVFTGTYPTDYNEVQGQLNQRRNDVSLETIAAAMAGKPAVQAKSNTQLVNDTYQWAYGRQPTTSERTNGVNALNGGTPRGTWVLGISESDVSKVVHDADVKVTMPYLGMLRRVPDGTGFAYWKGQVRSGVSVTKLVGLFQYSDEYRNRF
jgi:hypothetical protein